MHFGWMSDSRRSGGDTNFLFNHLRHDRPSASRGILIIKDFSDGFTEMITIRC